MADKVLIPEIIEPDSALPRDLVALRKFAYLLDAAIPIPGVNRRIGLAPAIGLVPGIGDAIGSFLSTWIVVGALRHRVPAPKIARMLTNIIVDLFIGTIPVLGDLIDILWPENLKNVELLLRYRDRTRPPRSYASFALVIVGLFFFMAMLSVIAILFVILFLYFLLRDIPLY